MMLQTPIVTDLDAARIRELGTQLPEYGRATNADLSELIGSVVDEADIVSRDAITADIVTLNSTVSYCDEPSGEVHKVTVVYPRDTSISEHRISVLSPVGRALLGRKTGETISLSMLGAARQIRIVELHYQPEAAGDPG